MKPTRLFSFFPRLGAMLLLAGTTLSADERPNIVILYVDDMGYGDLGANNPASKILTPHLDKLAAEGTWIGVEKSPRKYHLIPRHCLSGCYYGSRIC
jgi:hypothetical protein